MTHSEAQDSLQQAGFKLMDDGNAVIVIGQREQFNNVRDTPNFSMSPTTAMRFDSVEIAARRFGLAPEHIQEVQ